MRVCPPCADSLESKYSSVCAAAKGTIPANATPMRRVTTRNVIILSSPGIREHSEFGQLVKSKFQVFTLIQYPGMVYKSIPLLINCKHEPTLYCAPFRLRST